MPSERDQVDHLISLTAHRVLTLQETLALGLMVFRKWDKADTAHNGNPTPNQVAAFDEFTPTELRGFRDTAARMLAEHAAILPQLKREGWSRGFWQGFAAAWAYAICLAAIAVIIKLNGSDVLSLLRHWLAQG